MDVRDTIADLAAVGGVVLGGNPVSLRDIDIRAVGGSLIINGGVREQGTARGESVQEGGPRAGY
jgi:2-keto-4-pentenoate hydratase